MNRRNERQRVIQELQRKQMGLDNDWFFNNFEHQPLISRRTKVKLALGATGFILLNLLIWGILIAMVAFGLSFVF